MFSKSVRFFEWEPLMRMMGRFHWWAPELMEGVHCLEGWELRREAFGECGLALACHAETGKDAKLPSGIAGHSRQMCFQQTSSNFCSAWWCPSLAYSCRFGESYSRFGWAASHVRWLMGSQTSTRGLLEEQAQQWCHWRGPAGLEPWAWLSRPK